MASGYHYSNPSNNQASPPLPFHLCFFLLTLLLSIGLSWYLSCESPIETMVDNTKFFIMVSPLVMLLAVHLISGSGIGQHVPLTFTSFPERDAFHGGSPWVVAIILVVLMFMISYQSFFSVRWFPLLNR